MLWDPGGETRRPGGSDTPPATSALAALWAVAGQARPAGTAPGAAGSTRAPRRPRIPVGNPCLAPRPPPLPRPWSQPLSAGRSPSWERGSPPSRAELLGGNHCRGGAPPRPGSQPRFPVAGGLKLRGGTLRGNHAQRSELMARWAGLSGASQAVTGCPAETPPPQTPWSSAPDTSGKRCPSRSGAGAFGAPGRG